MRKWYEENRKKERLAANADAGGRMLTATNTTSQERRTVA